MGYEFAGLDMQASKVRDFGDLAVERQRCIPELAATLLTLLLGTGKLSHTRQCKDNYISGHFSEVHPLLYRR